MRFASRGIAPERIHFNGEALPMRQHLELYQECDLGLDPFPYNGTTTTCEALLMGVPVISLAGLTHASRVGASFLSSLGLPEFIAATPAEYSRIAAQLTADPPRLAGLRASLRSRLLDSPLGQPARFTRHLEAALLQLCHQHQCEISIHPLRDPRVVRV
jgi:predicted O-linked N-acetylglucosamine transferase (SPINDLY family)